ncbi:MAG: NAD(P)-dependent oxidoreductase [Burkholderiaceae bacterium]|nr:NAD(P)-dependent oxidoreductase [Burkholderiaceae bacterium]
MIQVIEQVGFIGLGVMGEHMCRNLCRKAGLPIHVYDLQPQAVQRVLGDGAQARASAKDVAEHANVVFLSLPSIGHVEQVCLGPEGLLSGNKKPTLIVDTSTSDVARTRALAGKLAGQGVRFLDAPVARMPEAARDGTLLIMAGGAAEDFAAVRPLLECMGSDVVLCGETGCGQIVKIANNMVLMMNVAALSEALLICERAGMDGKQLLDVLAIGSAASQALNVAGIRALAPRHFPPGRFSAAYALKDVSLASALADAAGVDAAILTHTRQLLQSAVDQGDGQAYYPVFINHIPVR